jgi:hypothetical protein
MSTQQSQKTETKVPQQQQGKEYQSSQQKGKMEADIDQQSTTVKSQQESSMGEKSKVQGLQSGQQLPQGKSGQQQSIKQEKSERLYDIDVAKRDLEVKDYTCTLKMNESLNQDQRFLIGNMFVEFADIENPDQIRDKKLPHWPLDKPWYEKGHVPLQEKRTFRFRALLHVFRKYIFQFDELKDCQDEIGVIDYVSIQQDQTKTLHLSKKKAC